MRQENAITDQKQRGAGKGKKERNWFGDRKKSGSRKDLGYKTLPHHVTVYKNRKRKMR